MNKVWNLDPIYKGFEDPAFEADFQAMKEKIAAFDAFSRTLDRQEPLAGLRAGIDIQDELFYLANRLGLYASLRQAADTRDAVATSQMGRILAAFSDVASAQAAFKNWAARVPGLMDIVRGDDSLRDYEFYFSKTFDASRYLLAGRGEEIMARMELSGGKAWSDLQSYLTSTVKVHYDGGVTNLPTIRNMAYEADPAVRKAAYQAELACYDAIKDAVAFALNSIKLETISDCRLRGYSSPLERTLKHSDMSRETLDAMLGAMDEYLPKFWQYLKAKARALGHANGLPWYDLFAPMGKAARKYTTEEARDYLLKQFATFDGELTDMVAQAFDNAWIDFYPRDGKTGGAFCSGVDCLGESRILTNFDGIFSDIVTLAHELGHAFHNWCLKDQRPMNRDYSMPVAETASTFNECIVMNAAIAAADNKEELLLLIETQLQDVCQIICDIYSRFRFEAMVFENRDTAFMHADDLCGLMLKAQKECYGDGLDHEVLHPYMWVCKSHYYGPTFYNFPYAFGGLFARGLYAQYQKEGPAFVPKYKELLRATAVSTAEDAAKVAGIDLTDKEFWRSALQSVADQIDLFCRLVEE